MLAKCFGRKGLILLAGYLIFSLGAGCVVNYKQKAQGYLNSGRFAEAIETYRRALKDNPNDSDAHLGLGRAYLFRAMRFNKADMMTKLMLSSLISDKKELQDFLGTVMCDSSLNEFKRAVELNPDNADAYYWLGYAYFLKIMPEESIKEIGKAVALKPNYADAHYALSCAYIMQAKALLNSDMEFTSISSSAISFLDSAKEEADKALKLKPSFRNVIKEIDSQIVFLNNTMSQLRDQKAAFKKKLSETAEQASQGVVKPWSW